MIDIVISVTESDKVDQGSEFFLINLIKKDMVLVYRKENTEKYKEEKKSESHLISIERLLHKNYQILILLEISRRN